MFIFLSRHKDTKNNLNRIYLKAGIFNKNLFPQKTCTNYRKCDKGNIIMTDIIYLSKFQQSK